MIGEKKALGVFLRLLTLATIVVTQIRFSPHLHTHKALGVFFAYQPSPPLLLHKLDSHLIYVPTSFYPYSQLVGCQHWFSHAFCITSLKLLLRYLLLVIPITPPSLIPLIFFTCVLANILFTQ